MKKNFILTINGSIYLFDYKITDDNLNILKEYAKKINNENLEFKTIDEAYSYFVDEVEKKLGIILHPIYVTDIIRINIKAN